MADRHAVGRFETTEVVPLHDTGEALTDSVADDIDELADDEMLHREFSADIHHRFGGDAELDDLALRLDIRLGEVAEHGLGPVLRLGTLPPDLKSGRTVLLPDSPSHHLAIYTHH